MAPAVEEARVAVDGCRWGDASRLLSGLPIDELEIEDLDRLATAAYLTGRCTTAFDAWARAHAACVSSESIHRAVHFGARLAQVYGFTGDFSRCRGWIERTARVLDEASIDCVEQGYVAYGQAMIRLFAAGDVAGAHTQFCQAGKIAGRFAHRELTTLARIGEGRMLVYLGDVVEGMALLDEALVSVEAGELSAVSMGDSYCSLIDACAELLDVERCRSWTGSFSRWCGAQQELVIYRGHCFLHRAEVLDTIGEWAAALNEARHACDRLADPVIASALGGACVVEADLLRRAAEYEGAEAGYRRASDLGSDPQPGLALLRLDQGRIDVAVSMIRRALVEAQNPVVRVRLLGPGVEILLVADDTDAAAAAAAELEELAAGFDTPFLMALAERARGAVLLALGDAAAALVTLRAAFNRFHTLGAAYEAARTRLLVGEACAALGDREAAGMEADAARGTLAALRASAAPSAAAAPGGLSSREVEVLVLLAEGKTNRMIADELVISEKTVASHVSHIFTKIGVGSRSAATAYAYDHDLV